jgi:regulator of sirC expression with transglutaminase-like and TPR domain
MHELPLTPQFREFARAEGSAVDGALLVARILHADTDENWIRSELQRLADSAGAVDGTGLVDFLKAQGFVGAQSFYTSDNSSLEHVLKSRHGIPITLALVVLGVAEILELPATGINFPQHFLVSVDGVLADPFRMSVIDPVQLRDKLNTQGLSAEQAFPAATPVEIVLRMLNNLRMLAMQRSDHAQALDLSGYQLLITTDKFPFHVERIDLWLAVGVPAMALRELDEALVTAPNEAMKSRLVARRAELESTPQKLH